MTSHRAASVGDGAGACHFARDGCALRCSPSTSAPADSARAAKLRAGGHESGTGALRSSESGYVILLDDLVAAEHARGLVPSNPHRYSLRN